MPKVLITGSIAYDLLLSYDGSFKEALEGVDLEKLSAAFVTSHFAKHHGGTGANIAWNLKLLAGEPLLVGTVGKDGGEYLALMEEYGVDTAQVEQIEDDYCSTAILGTDTSERQLIFYHPGADNKGSWPAYAGASAGKPDLDQDRDDIAYAIVSPRNDQMMTAAVDWCSQNKVPVMFDPGQQVHAFGDDSLRRAVESATALICNAYEWEVVSTRLNLSPTEALEHLDYLIVTQGEAGVAIHTKDGELNVAACKVENVVNPTGAGDGFRAGFLYGLANNWNMTQAAQLGSATAAFVVEREGTLLDKGVDRDMVWERAASEYREELPKRM